MTVLWWRFLPFNYVPQLLRMIKKNATFIFDRCHRSLSAATPVNYEWDSKDTGTLAEYLTKINWSNLAKILNSAWSVLSQMPKISSTDQWGVYWDFKFWCIFFHCIHGCLFNTMKTLLTYFSYQQQQMCTKYLYTGPLNRWHISSYAQLYLRLL